jgi:hypothetical protein
MVVTRYIAMSIPGREDDGRDTYWYVYDMKLSRSRRADSFETARDTARVLNAIERARTEK